MGVTVEERTALSRLVKLLAELVTGAVITAMAKQERLPDEGSSKAKRLAAALTEAWSRIRQRDGRMTKVRFQQIIATLTMEGHRRFTLAKVKMSHADVDAIVKAMRDLDLDPGDLATKRWRKDFAGHRERRRGGCIGTGTRTGEFGSHGCRLPTAVVPGPRRRGTGVYVSDDFRLATDSRQAARDDGSPGA